MAGPPSAACPTTAGHIRRVSQAMADAGGGCGEPGAKIAGDIPRVTKQRTSVGEEMRGSCREACWQACVHFRILLFSTPSCPITLERFFM